MSDHLLRDPTAESSPVSRVRLTPGAPLASARVGLFSINKERSGEFMDYLQARLDARGLDTRRFAKATHTKIAAEQVIADMVADCDIVIAGLAD
tara:strand:- start:5281 stop:5562 length:282 start_codon:yes stop_codon:yes gene_type:complete